MSSHAAHAAGTAVRKVLIVHNRYRVRGGEDAVVDAEAALLAARGHPVLRYEAHNDSAQTMASLPLAARTIWSRDAHRELAALAAAERPDIVHIHNTFPLISPAAVHAAAGAAAAVVQTLHNFRLVCPQGQFLRRGRLCEDCLGRTPPWPGVLHGCYRGSRAATAPIAAMLTAHRAMGTWKRVDAFIALSEFARAKLVEGGLPADRMHVKPNFVDPDPGPGAHDGDFLLFVGRLSAEKGVGTLLEGWRLAAEGLRGKRLLMVGDGPLAGVVGPAAAALSGLHWLGHRSREDVLRLMGQARALVFPSITYENFPGVVAEAYARGLPVIGSRLGSIAEMVEEGGTGILFTAGDPASLAGAMRRALGSRVDMARMGGNARRRYESRYTAEHGYRRLMEVYGAACARRPASGPPAGP